ncbi:ABC transporter substrate-binding protein [Paenibacillus hexagrammi]|uniref:ABC transporter substrate-binding protein n=1 Tax=Paenibacillus hexagrammi TaxID=2908839 RepID=A0ABY3SHR3_9BACL|nr:ABC transporter substrate-binding protein [Paenibacillus sp. YPD9-1]UJF32487.1 ABC transporter substrate-binding protein [Paenibacillus sp. YPD9-1]
MKNRKQFVVLNSLVLMLAAGSVLAGCSKSPAEPASSAAATQGAAATDAATNKVEPFNVSVYIGDAGFQQPAPDNKIYKLMKDKLGVTFQFDFLAGDSNQKAGVMIAGGDYPDIMTANTKFTDAGAYIPLEDLIEKNAPNLKKHYEAVWNQMKDPKDGHIYILPNYGVYTGELHATYYSGPAFWIQKAVLKEAGYPKIKTLDEYFALIKNYKEKHPEIDGKPTIGFDILNYDWRNWGLLNPPQHLMGHPNDGGVVVENNVASIFADKDPAKQYYKKLNEINNQGLLDKESFVQNFDQYMAKISSGSVLGMFDQHWSFQAAEDALTTQDKNDRTYVGLPLMFNASDKDYYRDLPPLNLNNGFGISVNAKDPVRILKMLDALMSEEWQKTLTWGIQGEDYQVNDKGMFSRTEQQRKNATDATWKLSNTAEAFYKFAPKWEGSFPDGNATAPNDQPDEYYAGQKAIDKELLDAYGYKTYIDFFSKPPANPVYYPAWSITLEDGSPAKIANTKLNELGTKYLPKAILSTPDQFDNVWNEYTGQIKKVDVKAYEDRINEQIQWRIKNWSTK